MVMEQYHYELQHLNLPGELGKKGQTKLGKSEFNYWKDYEAKNTKNWPNIRVLW